MIDHRGDGSGKQERGRYCLSKNTVCDSLNIRVFGALQDIGNELVVLHVVRNDGGDQHVRCTRKRNLWDKTSTRCYHFKQCKTYHPIFVPFQSVVKVVHDLVGSLESRAI